MKKSFLIIIMSTSLLPVMTQDLDSYQKKIFRNGEESLNYRILYPLNFDPDQPYPLLLFLHGAGERGDDNEKQLVHGGKLFLQPEIREKFPAVVVFPQCPASDYWVNRDPSGWGKGKFSFSYQQSPTVAMSLVMQLLDTLLAETFIDNNRVYLGGLSMGGMGTFELLYRRPEVFAAAFPICGGGDPSGASAYATKTPLWVFHGAKDDVVPPGYSEIMVNAIRKAGGVARFTLYPDANHNSWDPAFSEPGLLPWIFSNKK